MIRDIFEKILFMGSQAVPVIVIVFCFADFTIPLS